MYILRVLIQLGGLRSDVVVKIYGLKGDRQVKGGNKSILGRSEKVKFCGGGVWIL